MIFTLSAQQLSFQQGKRSILHNLSFELPQGQLIGLIGINGAGKSTLLKCLCGFYPLHQGAIYLNHHPLNHYNTKQRAQWISYLPQHQDPAFAFNVESIIRAGAFCHDHPINEEKFTIIIDQLDLHNLTQKTIQQLSGGEQQRVYLAQSLLQQAPIMLLDEPTASLDMGQEAHVMQVLRHYCQRGHTILVALHDLNTALSFCDQIMLLEQGTISAFAPPERVLDQPTLNRLYQDKIQLYTESATSRHYVLPNLHK